MEFRRVLFRSVVLDKTGTITEGRPRLVAVETVGEHSREEVLRLAASTEAASEHPLARAIVDAADAESLDLPEARDFQATAGQGVEASVAGGRVLVGTPRFLRSQDIDVSPAEGALDQHEAQAQTTGLVSVGGTVAGGLAIRGAAGRGRGGTEGYSRGVR